MERGLETREIINKKEIVEAEEEERISRICRICHGPGNSENPLQYPCACSGSMKFVPPKCILHWIEVCKHKFPVYRVFAENIPTALPLREFLAGTAMKACHLVCGFVYQFSAKFLWYPYLHFGYGI
ncbi:hypothetical protein MKW94_021549 [Papaver nudicaule]|uniref:RING-type E3 ubiquitin transferase n=1 Tax=Papaver nudicaule TaxID=74823 RepID=A0AA42AT93_PAPNU|nr:hypothetical protein [Papaver nudicaule]